ELRPAASATAGEIRFFEPHRHVQTAHPGATPPVGEPITDPVPHAVVLLRKAHAALDSVPSRGQALELLHPRAGQFPLTRLDANSAPGQLTSYADPPSADTAPDAAKSPQRPADAAEDQSHSGHQSEPFPSREFRARRSSPRASFSPPRSGQPPP